MASGHPAAYRLLSPELHLRVKRNLTPKIMSRKPKAVVLLSGGMDSCVTAAIAHETHQLALGHASYGQATERRERQSFDEIADFYSGNQRLLVRLDPFWPFEPL